VAVWVDHEDMAHVATDSITEAVLPADGGSTVERSEPTW
jgi:hypothetical protein